MLYMGLLQPTAFKAGKLWVFPFAGGAFIFAVKLYNEMFTRAFYKDLSYFESNCPFVYLLFIYFIHDIAFLKGLFCFWRT